MKLLEKKNDDLIKKKTKQNISKKKTCDQT